MQDGFFIDDNSSSNNEVIKNIIDYFFGIQLFNRGFHQNFTFHNLKTVNYDPHYSRLKKNFPGGRVPIKAESLTQDSNSNSRVTFARHFRGYVQNNRSILRQDEPYTSIPLILEELDGCQLQKPLQSVVDLKKVLFNPDYTVDLSGDKMEKEFSSPIFHKSFLVLTGNQAVNSLTVKMITDHFKCYEYLNIEKINLSNNSIKRKGALKIAKTLANNFLPHLVFLNLSSNKIKVTNDVLEAFEPLLKRDAFSSLNFEGNFDLENLKKWQMGQREDIKKKIKDLEDLESSEGQGSSGTSK